MITDIICYVLLIFGAPLVVGGIAGIIVPIKAFQINEFAQGVGSMLATILMFHLFGTRLTFAAPIILAGITAVFLNARHEPRAIFPQIIGIAAAYMVFFSWSA